MKLIYLAHPYSSNGDPIYNYMETTRIYTKLQEEEPDALIFSPIHNFVALAQIQPMEKQHEVVLEKCLQMMDVMSISTFRPCDRAETTLVNLEDCCYLYLTGNWKESKGCQMELEKAKSLGWQVVEYE